MSAFLRPTHLLILDEALADHLLHCRLHERGRAHLAVAVAVAIVRNEALVRRDLAVELGHRLGELATRPHLIVQVFQLPLDPSSTCSARKTLPCQRYHLTRSSSSSSCSRSWSGATVISSLSCCRSTVRRIVIWNQSRRCSASGLRYSCRSRTLSPPSEWFWQSMCGRTQGRGGSPCPGPPKGR